MTLLRHIGSGLRTHRSTTVAVGVVVLIAVPTGFVMPADAWGALGQWMGAAGTVMAVMVALRIARREAAAEAARTRTENREKELAQARLVTGELIYPSAEEEYHYRGDLPESARITNHSEAQIFARRVEGFVHTGGGTVEWDIVSLDGTPFGEWDGPGRHPSRRQVRLVSRAR